MNEHRTQLVCDSPVSVAGVWWTRVLLHQRNNDLFSHVRQQRECRIDYEVYETFKNKEENI